MENVAEILFKKETFFLHVGKINMILLKTLKVFDLSEIFSFIFTIFNICVSKKMLDQIF